MKKKKKKKQKKQIKPIKFRNRKGKIMVLPDNLTLTQMVMMGMTRIGLADPDEPIKKHEWRAIDEKEDK